MRKIVLTGLKSLKMEKSDKVEVRHGYRNLKVQYCAVCRTDAKMWDQGHRDLIFPRVPGHEVVALDEKGKRFVVWPGKSCGECRFCTSGRENLCEEMKIMGFHNDGGFADYLLAPEKSFVPVPDSIPSHIACFAEPVGCVFNALEKSRLKKGERIIIYGGGSLGLISALVCLDMGVTPIVIEKSEEKIEKAGDFLKLTGIECVKDTHESEFDAVINACPDPIAFSLGIVKLGKGGRFLFFSGLLKNENIETNLLNLAHYKELALFGAYGLKKENMDQAIPFMERNVCSLEQLIEKIIPPEKALTIMPDVLSGKKMKYILDFTNDHTRDYPEDHQGDCTADHVRSGTDDFREAALGGFCDSVINSIVPVGDELRASAIHKMDNKTKPLGALGKLEDIGIQMSLIQKNLNPSIKRKALFVFAADHGITEEGVSAYPAEVTGQMVKNFLDGGAAINVLCRHHAIDIKIVDMGVNANFDDHRDLIKKKISRGTKNFAVQDAMTIEEAVMAVAGGMDVFFDSHGQETIDIVGLGEMGIGNTTSASAMISTITGITSAEATGRGTGVDNKGLEHKIAVIEKALAFHNLDPENGFEILQKIGGFEIAGIAGAVLAAASKRCAVVLDGVISTAAGLVASVINPDIKGYLISGHKSVETAQKAALSHMGIVPVIDFNMRLGEGTGAA
ncbi:MAG: nicotinate-nucleotide--dimethylbenzimidazole phosphoribosyltransferase, partial [Thermodesulfobacteriota bacterium]|nr:nicotinate-nucleotide--dimethylbenzimidazole phosphoribosyltransferase [Thermodesulfobacteriota bacterium]